MIKSIYIKNYVLIKEISINFDKGFNVITGETGSGKSLILDSISLLLGNRADRFTFKNNDEKCIIEGIFQLPKRLKKYFLQKELDFYEETIIRREFNNEGRSRVFINDTPILLSELTLIANKIVEIHYQNHNYLIKFLHR